MKDDKDTFKDMMDEEYGKDVTGCVIPFLILAVVMAAIIFIFT